MFRTVPLLSSAVLHCTHGIGICHTDLLIACEQDYFWNKTLHVSDSSSVCLQEFFTVHTAMVYVIQVCWQLGSRIIFGIKLYMFRTVPLYLIRSSSLYTQQWYMSYRFADSLRAGSSSEFMLIVIFFRSQTCLISKSLKSHQSTLNF